MNNYAPLIELINQKAKYLGWGSQLLENLAETQKISMGEAFMNRHGHKDKLSIPAKCLEITLNAMTFQFSDGSIISICPFKVMH